MFVHRAAISAPGGSSDAALEPGMARFGREELCQERECCGQAGSREGNSALLKFEHGSPLFTSINPQEDGSLQRICVIVYAFDCVQFGLSISVFPRLISAKFPSYTPYPSWGIGFGPCWICAI